MECTASRVENCNVTPSLPSRASVKCEISYELPQILSGNITGRRFDFDQGPIDPEIALCCVQESASFEPRAKLDVVCRQAGAVKGRIIARKCDALTQLWGR